MCGDGDQTNALHAPIHRVLDKALMIVSAANLGDDMPKADDRIMRGAVDDAQPPNTALTVTAVKDFRYGSSRAQHIEVTAK